jgi:hypothetical protein
MFLFFPLLAVAGYEVENHKFKVDEHGVVSGVLRYRGFENSPLRYLEIRRGKKSDILLIISTISTVNGLDYDLYRYRRQLNRSSNPMWDSLSTIQSKKSATESGHFYYYLGLEFKVKHPSDSRNFIMLYRFFNEELRKEFELPNELFLDLVKQLGYEDENALLHSQSLKNPVHEIPDFPKLNRDSETYRILGEYIRKLMASKEKATDKKGMKRYQKADYILHKLQKDKPEGLVDINIFIISEVLTQMGIL